MIFHKLTINRIILLIYIVAIVYLITALVTGDTLKLWLSIFVGTMTYAYLLLALWQKNRLVPLQGEYRIEMSREVLKCYWGNGKSQQMLWSDMRRISVQKLKTKDNLPSSEVWLRFHSYPWRKVLSIPSRSNEFNELYQKISQWDQFNGDQLNEAMRSPKAVSLTLWEKDEF